MRGYLEGLTLDGPNSASSMASWGFAADLEFADKEDGRNQGQSQPADDAETIHKAKQPGLGFEQIVVPQGCRSHRVGRRKSMGGQVLCSAANGLLERPRGCCERIAGASLMQVLTPLAERCDQGDAEASTPVAGKVCDA